MFVALAFADELLADPALLAAYGDVVGADDDITLVIFAPDADANEIAEGLGAQADIDADLLLLAVPGDQAEEVAAGVDCVYSRRIPQGAFRSLIRVDDTRAAQLLAMARDRSQPPVEQEPGYDGPTFRCNVCGGDSPVPDNGFDREERSCTTCGSTPRWRSVIHALSVGLFGRSLPIPEFPERRNLKGVGLSDWVGYANPLAEKLDYENTFYHCEPLLDIAAGDPAREGTLDFLISSEVFEHVAPPVARAFENTRKLLKPGGLLVLTVPWAGGAETREHFPELHDWKVVKRDGEHVLVNRTADGRVEEHGDLAFHGGPGETLEMRIFGETTLLRDLEDAGFVDVQVLRDLAPAYGIEWPWGNSYPIIARAPRAGAGWRGSSTLGGPDAAKPERAFPGMAYGDVMREHAFRYAWALQHVEGIRALDLGCGTAYGTEMLTWTAASVEGFDLWQATDEELPVWPGGATLHYGHDLCSDPLPPADVAVAFEVVEHLDDAPAALRRAWQSAGKLVVSFPNPVYHGSHHNPYHVNDWTLDELETYLRETARVRFGDVSFEHAHQGGGGLIREGRDPQASYWLVVATGVESFEQPTAVRVFDTPAPNGTVDAAVSATMKQEWNARARENAMHYIASGRDEWDADEFYASGAENIRDLVVSELELLTGGRDPRTLRALDIGCGMGRLTRALGAIFGEAHGVDVSGEMVDRGNNQLAHVRNVQLHETNGVDFALFEDASFDFVFSFIVFQHVPSREAVVSNLREAHRVLKPGSTFKFQVQGSRDPNYLAAPKDTWLGVSFSEEELRELADEIGFDVLRGEGAGTQYFWQWWRKR
jgi:SAM-dependent methyltransferase